MTEAQIRAISSMRDEIDHEVKRIKLSLETEVQFMDKAINPDNGVIVNYSPTISKLIEFNARLQRLDERRKTITDMENLIYRL